MNASRLRAAALLGLPILLGTGQPPVAAQTAAPGRAAAGGTAVRPSDSAGPRPAVRELRVAPARPAEPPPARPLAPAVRPAPADAPRGFEVRPGRGPWARPAETRPVLPAEPGRRPVPEADAGVTSEIRSRATVSPDGPSRSRVVAPGVAADRATGGLPSRAGTAAPQLITPAFAQYKAEIATTQAQVEQSRVLAAPTAQALKVAGHRVERASVVFESREATMSPRQRALAALQIEAATDGIRAAVSPPLLPASGTGQGRAVAITAATQGRAVEASTAIAADLENFARTMGAEPRPQWLKVVVRPSQPQGTAPPLAVYVLPLGLFLYAHTVEESKLHYLIEILKFPQPTSPAVGDIERGIRYAVWVGPQHATRDMALMVRRGGVKKYSMVDANAFVEGTELTFNEADHARLP